MICSLQEVDEVGTKSPLPVRALAELNTEERRSLRSDPSIPVALERFVVDERSVASILPSLIVLLHLLQVSILVHVVREDEGASLGRVAEVGGRVGRELADVLRGVREDEASRRLDLDGDGVEVDDLVLVGALDDGVSEGTVVQPECFAATCKGEFDGSDGSLDSGDMDSLAIPDGAYSSTSREAVDQDRLTSYLSSCTAPRAQRPDLRPH